MYKSIDEMKPVIRAVRKNASEEAGSEDVYVALTCTHVLGLLDMIECLVRESDDMRVELDELRKDVEMNEPRFPTGGHP